MTTVYNVQQVLADAAQGMALSAVAISDDSSTIGSNIDALEPLVEAGEIGSISFDDTSSALTLTGTQMVDDAKAIALLPSGYSLTIEPFAAQATQFATAYPQATIKVVDSAAAIAANLDALQAISGKLAAIIVDYNQGQTMTLTQAQLAADPAAIALIQYQALYEGVFVTPFTISGTFSVQQAVAAETLNGYISGLAVVDTAADLEAALTNLPPRPEIPGHRDSVAALYGFSSVTLTDAGTPTLELAYTSNAFNLQGGILDAITTPHSLHWTGVPVGDVAGLLAPYYISNTLLTVIDIRDTAVTVASAIDALQPYYQAGEIGSVTIIDGALPIFTTAQLTADAADISRITVSGLTAAAAIADAGDLQSLHGVAVQDGAASVSGQIDGLESIAAAGKLASVTLTDSGIPTIAVTTTQASADTAAFNAISGSFTVVQTASGSSESITGVPNALGNTVVFTDTAASYTITADGNGTGFTVSEPGMADHLSGIQALQFSDFTEIVASQTAVGGAAVTSAQVTTLYAAVFAREPDVPGLGFYEAYAKANPGVGIVAYGQYFLSSAEYTANSAHNYAQSEAGETQFITDTYSNLLGRAPEAGAVAFYEGVIDPMLSNLTPGTAAYSQALLVARATVLAYFSQSPEFLADVTVTAQNPASAQHWLQLV